MAKAAHGASVVLADDEVALPVTGDRPVLDFGLPTRRARDPSPQGDQVERQRKDGRASDDHRASIRFGASESLVIGLEQRNDELGIDLVGSNRSIEYLGHCAAWIIS